MNHKFKGKKRFYYMVQFTVLFEAFINDGDNNQACYNCILNLDLVRKYCQLKHSKGQSKVNKYIFILKTFLI